MKGLLDSPLRPEILSYLQKITEFCQRWNVAVHAQPDLYADLRTTTIITSAGASTRIEGATLTDAEILQRLDGLTIQNITDRDEAEVAGYIDCKKYIFDQYAALELSEHTIRSLHHMLMSYLSNAILPPDQRGAYKNITNAVVRIDHAAGTQEVIFETTPPGSQTDAAMQSLIAEYRACIRDPRYSALEVVAAFIVRFLAIHPFRDGNGRLSRLLTDLCMLRAGYSFCMYASHEQIIEQTKAQYYVALRQTQATLTSRPDINPWFLYFLKVVERQSGSLQGRLVPKKPGALTALEQQVYEMIQRHQPVTIGFLERESGMKHPTLKSILARLKKSGLVLMTGARKTSRYQLPG